MLRHLRVLALRAILLVSAGHPAFAGTFHISPSGNDGSPGTAAQPFATLQHTQQMARIRAGKEPMVNNSVHPHVWYSGSEDVVRHNIVFGPYRPALMKLGVQQPWGKEIDFVFLHTPWRERNRACDRASARERS